MTYPSFPQCSPLADPLSIPSTCPICMGTRAERFRARILGKYDIRYFYCGHCGLLQTEPPFWLEEAYSTAIAKTDTGLVTRNLYNAKALTSLLYFCFDPAADYVEYAGGYGLLTRLMRDRGFNFFWHDSYCQNIFARGFEWNQFGGRRASLAVTAFEVLEHVSDPVAFCVARSRMPTLQPSSVPH